MLGGAVIGAYLHGSAVLSGLRPSSDLDVLAIVDRPTADAERRDMVRRLLEISGRRADRGPARPVELTVIQASEVRPWRGAPVVELLYGEWLRDAFERGEVPAPSPMPDLGPEVALARQGDHPLFGPPAAALLDPVPIADLRRSVVAGVPSLIADLETDTRNVLLTFARIWFTLDTGRIASKDEAATWALDRLPSPAAGRAAVRATPAGSPQASHREVLTRARDLYLAGLDIDWSDSMPAAIGLADHMLAEIMKVSPDRELAGRPRLSRESK